MEWPQIPIKNYAITLRKANPHAGIQFLYSKVWCQLGLGAHCQQLAQSPVPIVTFQDDVPARLKLQGMQRCLKGELTPIH
jgi:hypothetical protein